MSAPTGPVDWYPKKWGETDVARWMIMEKLPHADTQADASPATSGPGLRPPPRPPGPPPFEPPAADSPPRPPVAPLVDSLPPLEEKPSSSRSHPLFEDMTASRKGLRRDSPPPILAPSGLHEEGRSWVPYSVLPGLRFGCWSHRGPESIWPDKENEDFAFAAALASRSGGPWVLAGVCDGVGNSTWAERGAMLAAQAFVEVVARRLIESAELAEEMQRDDGRRSFAEDLQQSMRKLLEADAERLWKERYVHRSWDEKQYERCFLRGPDAHTKRAEWLQTTLLAAALGPRGGFALLLGDGFVRVDRRWGEHVQQTVIPLGADERAPELRVSLFLSTDDIVRGLRSVPPKESVEVTLVMATDGVSKSPRHGLEGRRFASTDDCRGYLNDLAGRGEGGVEPDNMSVAFVSREMA